MGPTGGPPPPVLQAAGGTMKGYALMLAVCLTVLYGFVAHAAITSVPAWAPDVVKKPVDSAEMVWYGGTLDPVTVTGRRSEQKVVSEASACPPGRARS